MIANEPCCVIVADRNRRRALEPHALTIASSVRFQWFLLAIREFITNNVATAPNKSGKAAIQDAREGPPNE